MTDYSQLSDFEINQRIADVVMNGTWHVRHSHPDNETGVWLYGFNGIKTYDLPDYCNNPTDAWPIIVENRISVNPVLYTKWTAEDYLEEISSTHDNPLRAAMIVFLMMQEDYK